MKREFLINISFLLSVNLLIKPVFVFFIDSKAQDIIGTDIYGQYFALFNLAYILAIFTDLGIQNYNSRTIAQQNELITDYLPNILGLKIILSTAVFIIGILFTMILGYDVIAIGLFALIMLNQTVLSFILYLRTNISGLGKYRWDSLISSLDKLILIVILGIFLYSPLRENFDIYVYVLSISISLLMVLILVVVINFGFIKKISVRFDFVFIKQILSKSLPYSLVIILMAIYMRIDGILLERLLPGSYEAGVYAASYRVFDAFNNLGYLFAVLLLPMFASLLKDREKLQNLISTGNDLLLYISVVASVLMIVYSDDVLKLLYPQNFTDYYSKVLIFMMSGFFFVSLNYIYGTFLTSAGKIPIINRITFGAVATNLILNLILIPRYGALGAAITSMITQLVVLIFQYYWSIRSYELKFSILIFIKRIFFIVIFLFIAFVIRYKFNYNWKVLFAASGILSLFIGYMFGFLKISDFKKDQKYG